MAHDHPEATDFRFTLDRHTAVIVCEHVHTVGAPILRVSHDSDGYWQFLCNADHTQSDAGKAVVTCLEHVVARDPTVNDVAHMCTSHTATRPSPDAAWQVEDRTQESIREIIAEFGWWVGLIEEDAEGPGFAYTVGLFETFGHPEIILFGLRAASMHAILNTCGEMIRKGARFEDGAQVSDVLEGYDVRFRRVAANESYTAYLGCGCDHYGGTAFPVLQCLWPDKNRKFPGEDGAAAFLATDQPLLA